MQTGQHDNLIFVRLFPDEDVYDRLEEICNKYEIETAVVLSGLGQMKNFQLGYFKEKGNYVPQIFKEPHELLSLTGIISKGEDEYNFHLHASFGNEQKQVFGGHFIAGKVAVTNEIVLLKTDMKVKRKLEESTGLMGLFLQE